MTEVQELKWIKDNLGPLIRKALADSQETYFTEDLLAGIAMRETGWLIGKYSINNTKLDIVSSLMRGDFTRRPHDTEPIFHGYGFWQVDIDSFPDFVRSGDWKDPYKCCLKAIAILEGKKAYITHHSPLASGEWLERAITAAYNCGEGNEEHVLQNSEDLDARTTGKNYSAEVWRFRGMYNMLQ